MDKPATDWTRLKPLIAEALALDPENRERLLARIAAEDADLAAEARRILTCQADDDFLIPPHIDEDEPKRLIGAQVGAYRVAALCGSGGMGHVYRAVRNDGAYEAVAALKVLRHDLLARPLLRRFAIERQALARLAHPQIARLLDAGSLDDGRPWLLMEWIDGEPIDAYVRRRGLSTRRRIELMVQAARAVQFAHENLVIHRDLKPSNIFADSSGSVRLLDFGVAKLLDEPATAGQTTRSSLTRFLTPGYASPEQLADEPLTTASDVY
ncbi:MAG: serine/threonine protein kinase, partial [Planctomycetota bacterium]